MPQFTRENFKLGHYLLMRDINKTATRLPRFAKHTCPFFTKPFG